MSTPTPRQHPEAELIWRLAEAFRRLRAVPLPEACSANKAESPEFTDNNEATH